MMDEINRLIDEVYVNKIALKEYELKALQAQINPHFLHNPHFYPQIQDNLLISGSVRKMWQDI